MRFGPAKSILTRPKESRGATDKIRVGGRCWRKWEIIARLEAQEKVEPGQSSFLSHPRPPIYKSLEYSFYYPKMKYMENITCFYMPKKNIAIDY